MDAAFFGCPIAKVRARARVKSISRHPVGLSLATAERRRWRDRAVLPVVFGALGRRGEMAG